MDSKIGLSHVAPWLGKQETSGGKGWDEVKIVSPTMGTYSDMPCIVPFRADIESLHVDLVVFRQILP